MKIIRIALRGDERKALDELRRRASDYRSERAMAVLHCSDGRRATWIAAALGRSLGTVLSWLRSYQSGGLAGLSRGYSPGRPRARRDALAARIAEYLKRSPRDFKWGEDVWSVKVIIAQFEKETGAAVSESTVRRALSGGGYSFKRAKKAVPSSAPSKEEKLAQVRRIADEIIRIKADDDVEVLFLDESHFSTDPYVTRGWRPKGAPFFPQDSVPPGGGHHIWGVRHGDRLILLEERRRGDRKGVCPVPTPASGARPGQKTGRRP